MTGQTEPSRTPSRDPQPFAEDLERAGIPREMWPVLSSHGVGTLARKMGIVFEEMERDRVVATMPVQDNAQVVGLLHGGASAALAETLGSFAAAVHAHGKRVPVGVDLNITHHRSARTGLVRGICTPLHLGSSSTSHEVVIQDEDGRRIATARITNRLLDHGF